MAIIDGNHSLDKITKGKYLLLKDKRSEDNFLASFEGAKKIKRLKIIGYRNEYNLTFLEGQENY